MMNEGRDALLKRRPRSTEFRIAAPFRGIGLTSAPTDGLGVGLTPVGA